MLSSTAFTALRSPRGGILLPAGSRTCDALVRRRMARAEPLLVARRPQLGEVRRAEALERARERLAVADQRDAVGVGRALAAAAVGAQRDARREPRDRRRRANSAGSREGAVGCGARARPGAATSASARRRRGRRRCRAAEAAVSRQRSPCAWWPSSCASTARVSASCASASGSLAEQRVEEHDPPRRADGPRRTRSRPTSWRSPRARAARARARRRARRAPCRSSASGPGRQRMRAARRAARARPA